MRKKTQSIQDAHDNKSDAGWGNQIRSYVLQPYQMVKDLRTEKESTDVEAVMNGDLDLFIQSLLLQGVENYDNKLGN